MRVSISLLIDDCAPINNMYWEQPWMRHVLEVPNRFTRRFADLCAAHGVKGKFTVLPMPGGMGRIDERLEYLSPSALAGFLDIVRRRIAPAFDITPEILTHTAAHRMGGGALHMQEDVYFASASVEEMTDYIALSLQILKNVGLPASGVTSPWSTGIEQEDNYAKAIAMAQWRVNRRRRSWYFLHCLGRKPLRRPWVSYRNTTKGVSVVSIPALTDDVFWNCQAASTAQAKTAGRRGVDALLTSNGSGGHIHDLFEAGGPIIMLTHWQSLFSEGRDVGLEAFGELLARIDRVFGKAVRWVTCSDLMRQTLASTRKNRGQTK